ncbi:MAG: isoleucine--tRNA ligase, partial [Oscillospiraceae bacterium]|nr:isoleucine--tRNA ligase [Oscillospiraceae bacterium]
MDYNASLNLPKTDFPMRGNLQTKEPQLLEFWESSEIYNKVIENNRDKPPYLLHDGPPYANGEIHMGTALNKVLKDFIVKEKNMSGFRSVYVPGWDTHGLPIELKALKKMKVKDNEISAVELRKYCTQFALEHVRNQMSQFKRLGTFAGYENPYLTLKPEYEARQIEVFGKMAKDGYMYKGLKPVYWCPSCNTALAEAEIEYADDPCDSIYVKFNVTDDRGLFGIDLKTVFCVIWTTTTWTLPGNLAIALGSDYEYSLVKAGSEHYIIASELVEKTVAAAGIAEYETVGRFTGKQLEGVKTRHPLYDRESPLIVGDHVTLESGTGCVHTAPGHGVDDFEVCKKYPEIGILVPVDNRGVLTEEAGEFCGLKTKDANKAIKERLIEEHMLFASEEIQHQYPHCWRCSSPVIFRATQQWFCSVQAFKDEAVKAIGDVKWIPAWGEDRIKGMVRDRSDWCISRQRTWGVPIPVIYCKECGKAVITDDTVSAISDLFRKSGSDAWYTEDLENFIPSGVKCECGCGAFEKETDIMDVWFDSGVSHTSVLEEYDELYAPADLYLEGADQYRGWFQSSLLTSVVWRGTAPYKAVCTHGWVVDGQGRKMSKSLGNGVEPGTVIKQYGAEILRLWVASSDYHSDIRVSDEILKQLSDAYKKIRNTARFMLGNLCNRNGFDPETDSVPEGKWNYIDKYAVIQLDSLINTVKKGYSDFDFHIVFHSVYNYCITELSNFYLDIIKDRLYCEPETSEKRRAAQTVMYRVLSVLTRLIAPVMSFTAEEIWSEMPHCSDDNEESVFLNSMPEACCSSADPEFELEWKTVITLRESVKKALELKRADKEIGSSLEAQIEIFCEKAAYALFKQYEELLAEIFIVSAVRVTHGNEGSQKGVTVLTDEIS